MFNHVQHGSREDPTTCFYDGHSYKLVDLCGSDGWREPKRGEKIQAGLQYGVTWGYNREISWNINDTVTVYLDTQPVFNNYSRSRTLAEHVEYYTAPWMWTVPRDLDANTDFYIQVVLTTNSSIWCVSGNFRVFDPNGKIVSAVAAAALAAPSTTSSAPLFSTTSPSSPPSSSSPSSPSSSHEAPTSPAPMSRGDVAGIVVTWSVALIAAVLVAFYFTRKVLRRRKAKRTAAAARRTRRQRQHQQRAGAGGVLSVADGQPPVGELEAGPWSHEMPAEPIFWELDAVTPAVTRNSCIGHDKVP